jgi:hypothetical protein
MTTEEDSNYICKFVEFVIGNRGNIYPRISVQVLMLIRDCTQKLKVKDGLCFRALDYALFYLSDEKICHYAA